MTNPADGSQSQASGAGAVTAGVLAILGGIVWAAFTCADLVSLAHRSSEDRIVTQDDGHFLYYPAGTWVGWTALIEAALATALLLSGAILLLTRRLVGRLLIVIGCGVVIATIYRPLFLSLDYSFGDFSAVSVFALFPGLTMVLALAPATKRWCQSSRVET
jgi:hypothetical protein